MAISAYPRTAVQGTGIGTNKQNGLSLMLLNSTTGQYEAATSETFAGGGGGGGDATARNQTIQINEALNSNTLLTTINNQIPLLATLQEQLNGNVSLSAIVGFLPTLDAYLFSIKSLIETNNALLSDIITNQRNGTQRVIITDTIGVNAFVDSSTKALNVNVVSGA